VRATVSRSKGGGDAMTRWIWAEGEDPGQIRSGGLHRVLGLD
jgi:hypothetical protein